MASKQTVKGEIVKQYLEKYKGKNIGSHTLARIIYEKNKEIFKDKEIKVIH